MLQHETWPIDKLIEYARNPRKNDHAVDRVAAAIREFGFRVPVVAKSDGTVVDGHLRLKAAKKLGLTEVPVVLADDMTDLQIKAFRLSVNKMAELAEWDDELLAIEFAELADAGFDNLLTGFTQDEIDALTPEQIPEGLTDEDAVPEVQAEPVSKLGDVWLLGKHRVMCGDSTSIDSVETLMDGKKADFCFTSPPYNSAMKGGGRMGNNEGKGFYNDGYKDNRESEEYVQFNSDIISALSVVAGENFTCCYNINYNKNSPSEYIDVVHAAKQSIPLVETIVWEKTMAISLQGDNLTRIFEFVFVLCKGKFKINKNRTDCLKNLWKISNIGANHESHKACFPIKLVEEGIKNFAPHGAVIVEPFGGSGTTLIAAEKLGCSAFLMELDPCYVDVIVRRWQEFTGKQATHAATGATFAEVEADSALAVAEDV